MMKIISLLIFSFLSVVLAQNCAADITGNWNLTGTLQVNASVKGKTVSVKKKAYPMAAAFDTLDTLRLFSLTSKAFELPGSWKSSKSTWTGLPNVASVRVLLNGINKDLLARSNLPVSLEESKWTLTGKEVKSGKVLKISGTLTIKAKAFFQTYTTKTGAPYVGSVSLTYVFTGLKV